METKRLVETSAELTRLDKIHRLLSPPLPSFNHERALEQRQEGTGRWFIESQSFESFKQGRVPFLWLYGIPGCGKTILCSTIIQDLGQHLPDPTSPVLYFYFDFNDGRKRTIDAVLRSFLWQLIQNTGSSKQEEKQLLDLSSCPSVQILAEMLGRVLRRLGRVRMVLDALDECQTRLSLLPWLAALARQPNLHIVVTSRREYDIESEFQKWLQASACISLNQREVNVDIGSYVSARLQTDSELQRWRGNHKVQAEIIRIMTQKAGGM
jgi:Cdc6-like AAA superfamily ATPase